MHPTPTTRRARRARRAGPVLALAAVLAAGATGCGGSEGEAPVAEVSGAEAPAEATVLDTPFPKPDLVLTDTEGEPYEFVAETKGKPTLVYFGYTNCPDVCPTTMSNIAYGESQLSEAEQEELRVVFVTTDPERDTPESLGEWLNGAAPGATGLTGDFDTIQAGARTLGISIEPPVKKEDGEIESMHGSQVLFFSPKDDKAHVLYTEDTTAETYAQDLPKLVNGELP
ncbi:SCO family protein [Streptomyces sp. JJ66]|uniref:SCO family protein n=1 Tax=Streptomyces sp. JJ66 TaxID=2803843 RepID=UPI001C56ABF2|nr:SCO family protein [Streptomyces sp. JJ66]MBW1604113.1 SCO family protein [Streptomyces sp. JJ66]